MNFRATGNVLESATAEETQLALSLSMLSLLVPLLLIFADTGSVLSAEFAFAEGQQHTTSGGAYHRFSRKCRPTPLSDMGPATVDDHAWYSIN